MKINDALDKYGRFFIIPMDHPIGTDTPKLKELGIQNWINRFDEYDHDGYIFHAREYLRTPYVTAKDFFVTVGEAPEKFKADINEVIAKVHTKKVTIYYEVSNPNDESSIEFYVDYVKQLKTAGFLVMAMSFPSDDAVGNCYEQIVNSANRIGVDILKTDYYEGINKLDLGKLKLCIGGGPLVPNDQFKTLVSKVADLKMASYSFGRNIFEADNYNDRIELILKELGR